MVPGNPQPQLLETDEVVRRIRTGELPQTANVARLGETSWAAAKDLPEIKAQLTTDHSIPITRGELPSAPEAFNSLAGAPSPFASQAGGPAVTQLGEGAPNATASAPPAARPTPAAKTMSKGLLVGLGAAIGVLVLGVVGLTLHRNSYSRGLVLEHVPDDCAELYYVDIAGIAESDPVRSQLEKFVKNSKDLAEEEVSAKSKKDKERYERAIEALQKNGIEITTVREIALCVPQVDKDGGEKAGDKLLVLVGGTFRKGNVLRGLSEAAGAALKDEDVCKIEDDDGRELLKCSPDLKMGKKEPVYASLVDPRVLAISPDKKMVKSARTSKDRSKTYGADKGEHVVVYRSKAAPSWEGAFGETKLKIGANETTLVVETHYDPDKGKKKLEQFKDGEELVKKKEKLLREAADKCFDKSPLEALGEGVERTKVEAYDDGIRYEYRASNKELKKTFEKLADADKDDMWKAAKTWSCITVLVEPYSY